MSNLDMVKIPFNRPVLAGREIDYIREAIEKGQLAGDGPFTERCEKVLLDRVGGASAHLTHSCTAALEMAAILCGLGPGDEVIMPSYTFVSTANSVVLRGAVPVFVDIDPVTLNIDPAQVRLAVTSRTKAIFPVHYAGVIADMDEICAIASGCGAMVVEDAAQALGSTRNGKPAGSFGDFAAFSFHETKNIISGEGGALMVSDKTNTLPAEIIREKGTNRSQFFRGMVDKYSWVGVGSSYLPGELVAAFLLAQLERLDELNRERIEVWNAYHSALAELEKMGVRRPSVPEQCEHNAHMYYLIMPDAATRDHFIDGMKRAGIQTPFHYIPLHSSSYGKEVSRSVGSLTVTQHVSECLVRLPMYPGVGNEIGRVLEAVVNVYGEL